jgi:tRNA A37 methylthiotransferase MiaB
MRGGETNAADAVNRSDIDNQFRKIGHCAIMLCATISVDVLSATINGIGRIRFTTSHPVEFSESLIQVYAEVPELVSHLHLPVQSGSDRILALMKRGHMVLEYKSKIRKLRKIRPRGH